MKKSVFYPLFLLFALLLASCQKETISKAEEQAQEEQFDLKLASLNINGLWHHYISEDRVNGVRFDRYGITVPDSHGNFEIGVASYQHYPGKDRVLLGSDEGFGRLSPLNRAEVYDIDYLETRWGPAIGAMEYRMNSGDNNRFAVFIKMEANQATPTMNWLPLPHKGNHAPIPITLIGDH